MKFTNKILDIVTTAIMKKVEKKRKEIQDSEEFREKLNKYKEENNYEVVSALQTAYLNAKNAETEAITHASNIKTEYKRVLEDNKLVNFGYYGNPPSDPGALDNLFLEKVAITIDLPSQEEIQTAIIFANDSDIKAVEELVSTQFGL